MGRAILFFFFSVSVATHAQPHRVVIKDLRQDWKIQVGQTWVAPTQEGNHQTIYFSVDPQVGRGKYVEIVGVEPFSVWYGDKLLGLYPRSASLSVDSLNRIYPPGHFKVHAKKGVSFASAHLVRYSPSAVFEELKLREKPYFLNFCILAVLLLAVYFILLFQSNPKLILDYFNFSKLLSVQERDETLATGRTTSSINLLVYGFIGLFFSFVLTIVLHFTKPQFIIANKLSFSSVQGGLATWLKLSVFIVSALLLKMIIVSFATRLFKFRESYAIQVLNFFRHLSFLLVLFSATIIVYFVARVEEPIYYRNLVLILGWLLVVWVVLIFFKLLNKSPFSGFHLFSYLCATEIFPLVIFFEILFF